MSKIKDVTKEQWVKALRSGKYEQVQEELANDYGYCCLGVLACLKAGKDNMFFLENSAGGDLDPEQVNLSIVQQGKLIRLNDGGAPFDEIADYIQKYYPAGRIF